MPQPRGTVRPRRVEATLTLAESEYFDSVAEGLHVLPAALVRLGLFWAFRQLGFGDPAAGTDQAAPGVVVGELNPADMGRFHRAAVQLGYADKYERGGGDQLVRDAVIAYLAAHGITADDQREEAASDAA